MNEINEKMRILGSEKSAIRELFEQGKILKEKYGKKEVYDFSIGNPSVNAPDIVNKTLINLINNKNSILLHGYTSAQGDINVRQKISDYLNEKYKADIDKEYIYLTSGAAAAISISLKAIINKNDEIIVFTPYFPEYKIFIENAYGKMIEVLTDINNFYPNFLDFENKINKNTKAVIINSPNNPTGVFYDENIIKSITNILSNAQKKYNNKIFLISDEPYRELLYVDKKYPFITNYYDNSIVTYSFSKSLSIPGERIGYILINKNMENVKNVYDSICGAGRSMGYVCANTLFQYMIPEVLGKTADIDVYKKNKIYFTEQLEKIGYKVIKSEGAFYLFVKSLITDDIEFSKRALKYNLLLVPSTSFGIKNYVRIAYCVDFETIEKSINSFKKLYEECK